MTIDTEQKTDVDFEGDIEKAREAKDAISMLMRSQGWDLLSQWINGQVQLRRDATELTPLDNLLEVGAREFTRGEICFGRSILEAPRTIMEAAQLEIEMYSEPEENDND